MGQQEKDNRREPSGRRRSGFTLAELLIVVAIIGVLVAVAIPLFANQLERSREAADLANVRSAYAEVMAAANAQEHDSPLYDAVTKEYVKVVPLKQKADGWTTKGELVVGGISSVKDDGVRWRYSPSAGGKCKVMYSEQDQQVMILWSGYLLKKTYQWKTDGGALTLTGANSVTSWQCYAAPELIPARNKAGQKVVLSGLTEGDQALKAGMADGYTYEIGYFVIDAETNRIYLDSGGKTLTDASQSFAVSVDSVPEDADVNIAFQAFKVKPGRTGSVEMSPEEVRELEKMFEVK